MRTQLDCIPCFLRQGLEASRFVTADPVLQETIMREVLLLTAGADLAGLPVTIGASIHRRVRELTGNPDPYRAVKAEHNRLVTEVLPELSDLLRRVPDPLVTAARLAIAANVIDLGVPGSLTPERVLDSLRGVLDEPFHGDTEDFATSLAEAGQVLYLADNAGELAADLVIAKGQGNYESLDGTSANVFFLFKVKCPVVARRARLAVGTHALLPARAIPSR